MPLIGPKPGWEYMIDPVTGKERQSQIGGIGVDGVNTPKAKVSYKAQAFQQPAQVDSLSGTAGVIKAEGLPNTGQITATGSVVKEPLKSSPESIAIQAQNKILVDQNNAYKASRAILAGASFMADVFNANAAYGAASGQAQLNIIQARNQSADALFRGRQAQMDAQSQGKRSSDAALLNAAAQGQDVQGAGVEKIQGSFEALAELNGAREQINSMREALGFELEEINYDYQRKSAKIGRDSAIIGSALNLGANLIGTL